MARHLEPDLRRQGPQHPDEGNDLQQRAHNAPGEIGAGAAEQARLSRIR